jgi:competence protein ComEA
MGIRERLDTLSRAELSGLVALMVVGLVGAGLWYTRSLPRQVEIGESRPRRPPAEETTPPGSAGPTATAVVVDVAGWVEDPGVYEFQPGQRVIDAINQAGGPKRGADLSSTNLAAVLVDGTQILVPTKNEAERGGAGVEGSTAQGGTALVNINTADETQLQTLGGIGPVLSSSIVQYRTEHGPFKSVDDLMNVSGIGPKTMEKLRPFVTI